MDEQAFWNDLTARIALIHWVEDGEVNQRIVRIALRHCHHKDLTPRFNELVDLAATDEFHTAPDLLWQALWCGDVSNG